jgi:hypothetical protein
MGLTTADMVRATPPRGTRDRTLRFRFKVALHHLLQPLARAWGRSRNRANARRDLPGRQPLPVPCLRVGHGLLVMPEDRPRPDFAMAVISELRRSGVRVIPASGWEDYDARVLASTFVYGDLQTSSHPTGFVQLRIRRRLRRVRLGVAAAIAAAVSLLSPSFGVEIASLGAFDALDALVVIPTIGETVRGIIRCRLLVTRTLPRAARLQPG